MESSKRNTGGLYHQEGQVPATWERPRASEIVFAIHAVDRVGLSPGLVASGSSIRSTVRGFGRQIEGVRLVRPAADQSRLDPRALQRPAGMSRTRSTPPTEDVG